MRNFIILGDSIMKGVIYSNEKNKYKLCKENNFDFINNNNFNLINKSKMGATINYCEKIIQNNLELFKNSDVLLSFGGNDCNYNWKEVSQNPKEDHLPFVTPENFKSTYINCINSLKKFNANVFITNLVPIDSKNYFNWISKNLNSNNILEWLGDEHVLYRWHEHYSNIINEISNKCKCPLIDIRNPFLEIHKYKQFLCIDGIHPNINGYEFLQEKLQEKLMPYINLN